MTTTLLTAAALGFLAAFTSVRGELAHPAKPLLWKIDGGGVRQVSYLFGTIHVGKGPVATLHPTAEKAFAAATAVHTEAPLDPATQLGAVALVVRDDGRTLSESIGEQLTARLDAELNKINPALDSTPFQSLKTWYVAIMLQVLPLQIDGTKPLDMLLWERAAEDGKKVAGMQTLAEQLAGFKDFTEAEQVILMSETLRLIEKDRDEEKNTVDSLVDAYLTGDAERILAEWNVSVKAMLDGEHPEIGKRLLKGLLTDRDALMADYIAATLKADPEGVHFFAAGAAHYIIEEGGVRSHLVEKGYTVTRVE